MTASPPAGTLQYALAYAGAGMQVIPLPPLEKEAREKGHYCLCTGGEPLIGSADPAWIRTRWAAEPRSNAGVVTGQRSRLLVLDLDIGRGGLASFQRWSALRATEGRYLPPHVSVLTPTGGRHHYLRLPDGLHLRTNTAWLPGVDVKACGGYVAAPPSVRRMKVEILAEGDFIVEDQEDRLYGWEPGTEGLPEAPGWLLEDVTSRREGSAGGAGAPADDVLPPTAEFLARGFGWHSGSRNRDAFRLACRLWGKVGLRNEAGVLEVLRMVWLRTEGRDLSPPDGFPWTELEYAVHSARTRMRSARAAERAALDDPDDPRRRFAESALRRETSLPTTASARGGEGVR